MASITRRFSIGLVMLALAGATAWAQATAQLSGRVTDASGLVLPGATVTATQTSTSIARTVVTDSAGRYALPNLPIGPYRLEVMLQGFSTYVQTGIVLQVAATPVIDPVLSIGGVEESVTVDAAAPLVDTVSAGLSDVVQNQEVLAMPLDGRNVADLIVLAGAAVRTGEASSRSMTGGVAYSVAGGQSFGVAFSLDGALHNNPQDNLNLPLPFPDAMQEFSVATSGLTAENGVHAGASVNAVTKSGTNAFRGNAFEFLRDKRFNATSPFASRGPDGSRRDDGLKRNQFGGTIGGPIRQDRLFFFGAYQGTAIRRTPADRISFVPTPAMMAGDFTAFAAPVCNGGRQITLRAPFVNNRVDPALFSPAAVNLAKRLPSSNDPCGQTTFSQSADQDEWQAVGRLDFQATANHSLFGRYMATSVVKPPAFAKSDNVLTVNGGQGIDNLAQSAAFGDTVVFGANSVNAVRFAFNRTAIQRKVEPFFDPKAVGSNVHNYSPVAEIGLTVTGGFSLAGGTSSSGIFDTNTYSLGDDFTTVRGSHQLSLGGSVAYWKMSFLTHARSGGAYTFTGQLTGLGLADFLMGRLGRLEHGGPGYLPMNQYHLGLYAQDTWRMAERVTLNAGLRWEPFFGQSILNNAISNFSMDNFRTNVGSVVFRRAPAGLIYPGDAGFPSGRSGLNTQWWNLSPRVGLAWDIAGDGRTAMRASYGIAYDFPTAEYHNINAQAPPFGNRSLVEDPPGRFDDPYGHLGGDPHPIVTSADTEYIPYGAFGAIDPDINSPRIQQWNVTIERQLWQSWQVAASYLGSYTDHLWGQVALNPGVFLGTGRCTINGVNYAVCSTNGNLNARRVFSLSGENPAAAELIGNLDQHTDIGTQDYRGLKLSVRRRSAGGVSISSSYTLGRCYGDNTTGGFPQLASGYTDPSNPDLDRGYCSQDRTHIGTASVAYLTPDLPGSPLRALASSWQLSGNLSARSGDRLNVITGRDNALTGLQQQRVNQVSDDVYGEKVLSRYLNAAAFAQPAPGTLGNFERNSLVGPSFWSVNVAVAKLVPMMTAQTLELRLEAFNLFNTFNWGNPTTNFNSGNFGRILSQAGDPRVVQFGVKYGF